jgi:class 3 adenylate cyclase
MQSCCSPTFAIERVEEHEAAPVRLRSREGGLCQTGPVQCGACGRENPSDASFCAACGGRLTAQDRIEERKVVSVLFADLVGFTSRSEQLDVEDVRGTLAPFHARVRQVLESFGGTVEKFIGDAVMAVFGAPVAHEDDAERRDTRFDSQHPTTRSRAPPRSRR